MHDAYRFQSTPAVEGAETARLVRAARTGDFAAFNQLVALHQDEVFHYACFLTRDDRLADELTQAAFTEAYASFAHWQPVAFRTGVLQLVTRLQAAHRSNPVRRFRQPAPAGKVRGEHLSPGWLNTLGFTQPPKPGQTQPVILYLNRVLQLPDEQRQVVTLVDLLGLSYAATAYVTGMSAGQVRRCLAAGRAACQGA